jgi:hypothetical protein
MRRTQSLIRDDAEPCVFLGIQLSGSSIIIQHDREVVLRPGEMVLYDATQPYTHVNSSGLHKACFRIPRTALGLSQKAVEAVSVTSLNGDSPVAEIAAGYFADVARHVHELGDGLDELAAPSIASRNTQASKSLSTRWPPSAPPARSARSVATPARPPKHFTTSRDR